MPHFRTCTGCAVPAKECEVRAILITKLAGLGVTSVKHRCPAFVPMFTPGAPVLVQTVAWMSRDNPEDENDPPSYWYRGHFIRYAKSSPIVFVKPGTEPEDGPEEHALDTRGFGFIKAARYRVKSSDWSAPIDVAECSQCGAMTTLGQPCGRDVDYHSLARCQAALNGIAPVAAAHPAVYEPEDVVF